MANRKGLIPVILIAVLALVIAVGGVGIGLAWRTNYLDKWLPPSIKEFFGKWKTYRDEFLGFEMKYPAGWEVSGGGYEVSFSKTLTKDSTEFSCDFDVRDMGQEEFEDYEGWFTTEGAWAYDQSTQTVAGVSATKFTELAMPDHAKYFLKSGEGDRFFVLVHWVAEEPYVEDELKSVDIFECRDAFNQMLSTFRFTKKEKPEGRAVFVWPSLDGRAIYWVKLDGAGRAKIWENKAGFDDFAPWLSPDKQRIIFLSTRDNQKDEYGNLKSFLYYNDISGRALQKLSQDTNLGLGRWLPDGSEFVYMASFQSKEAETEFWEECKIVKIPALTVSTLVRTTDFGVGNLGIFALSPKSDWIAFVFSGSGFSSSGKSGIYLIHPDGTGLKKISSAITWTYLKFSRDAKQVTYNVQSLPGDSGEYYSYDITTGTETKIPALSVKYCSTVVHSWEDVEAFSLAQNLRAFIDCRDGKDDIYVSKEDGSSERRVTFAGGVRQVYFAGPNDRYLVYWVHSLEPAENAIYMISLEEGSKPHKVADIFYGFAGVVPE